MKKTPPLTPRILDAVLAVMARLAPAAIRHNAIVGAWHARGDPPNVVHVALLRRTSEQRMSDDGQYPASPLVCAQCGRDLACEIARVQHASSRAPRTRRDDPVVLVHAVCDACAPAPVAEQAS